MSIQNTQIACGGTTFGVRSTTAELRERSRKWLRFYLTGSGTG